MKQNTQTQMIKVWDAFVRTFHWSLVTTFVLMYVTSHAGMQNTHMWLGYFLFFLIAARLIWGFIGSTHARFRNFIYSPRQAILYLKSAFTKTPMHYLGHNPAGAMMVFVLFVSLITMIVSGFVLEATIEYEGPWVTLLNGVDDNTAYAWEGIHHGATNLMLALIVFHLLGVISASLQHKENLVRAMITGYKPALEEGAIHD